MKSIPAYRGLISPLPDFFVTLIKSFHHFYRTQEAVILVHCRDDTSALCPISHHGKAVGVPSRALPTIRRGHAPAPGLPSSPAVVRVNVLSRSQSQALTPPIFPSNKPPLHLLPRSMALVPVCLYELLRQQRFPWKMLWHTLYLGLPAALGGCLPSLGDQITKNSRKNLGFFPWKGE